jgi:hypothetical protein
MKRFVLIATVLLSASCSTYHYVSEDAASVDDITLILPYSRVFYIDKDGESYDEKQSVEQQKILTGLLYGMGLPIKDTLNVVGLPNQKDLDEEISFLPAINPKEVGNLNSDGPVDKLLEKAGARYGLIIFSEGFVKDKALYKSEVAKTLIVGVVGGLVGAAIGGALGGSGIGLSYVATPGWDYGSSLYAMLIDTQTDKVLYYNRVNPEERNPMKSETLASQLEKLLKKLPR